MTVSSGTNRVQSKIFEFEPVKKIEGQIEIIIKERFEIQTIISFSEQKGVYDSKVVSIPSMDKDLVISRTSRS